MPALTTIQLRRGTSSQWSSATTPLSQGEMGFDTVLKKFKIGDGSTLWNSLPWANIVGTDFIGSSGINISYSSPSGTFTVAVTGLNSSYISDFASSVSGLLPVKSILAGNNITVSPTGDNGFVISSPVNENTVKDIIGSTITGVSGVLFNYNSSAKTATISLSDPTIQSTDITDFNTAVSGLVNGIYAPLNSPTFTGTVNGISKSMVGLGNVDNTSDANKPVSSATQSALNLKASLAGATFTGPVVIPSGSGNFNTLSVDNIPVSVSGHTHLSSSITNFNSAVSGLLGVKSIIGASGIGIVNNAGNQTISITGIPSSLITDLGNIASTEVVGRTGISLTYDTVYDIMYIDATGLSFAGHTHSWSNLTDASATTSLSELAYLSGVIPGSASASRALVVDSSKNLTGVNTLTTLSDVTVGGNLVVQGTTTTVNSSTVNIGDNIIRVNTSGLSTGGLEVYTGSTTQAVLWNNVSNRWEFTGSNVYTSGNFIGSLSGNAATVTNGVYTTDTGTVTNTMLAGSIANDKLVNNSVTIGSTSVSLGSTVTTFAGLSSVTAITFVGSLSGTANNVVTNANLTGPITSIGNATTISSGVIDNTHISATGAIAYSKLSLGSSIVNSDISSSAAIAYSKLNLSNSISNSDISSSAAIAVNKLASSGVTIGNTTINLGTTTTTLSGLTSISGVSAANPTTLYYCVIDGGTP